MKAFILTEEQEDFIYKHGGSWFQHHEEGNIL
jgi:hypothetical protein